MLADRGPHGAPARVRRMGRGRCARQRLRRSARTAQGQEALSSVTEAMDEQGKRASWKSGHREAFQAVG